MLNCHIIKLVDSRKHIVEEWGLGWIDSWEAAGWDGVLGHVIVMVLSCKSNIYHQLGRSADSK